MNSLSTPTPPAAPCVKPLRCSICGATLLHAEHALCDDCAQAARDEIEIINAHFRVPAGQLARLNPGFLRRTS